MTLPTVHSFPFIGALGLYKIATLDPQGGEPFGTSKKGKNVTYPMTTSPIDGLFGETQPGEAMFVCYRHADGIPIPRLTKACEGRIPLVADMVWFDADLNQQFGEKGKLSWAALGEERTAVMDARVALLKQVLAEADAPLFCWYRTKNGLRFGHQTHETITMAGLEMAIRRLAPIYLEADIVVDPACSDWTRCFKVPRCVLDDGTVTGDCSWFRIEWSEDAVTVVTPEEVAAQPREGHAGEVSAEARQEASHARDAVEQDGKLTADGLQASHALRADPELHHICFGSDPIPVVRGEGKTHTTLTKLVGRLTRRCAGYPWATERFLYGLLAMKVARLGDDEDWGEKVWGMVCDYLASDRAAIADRNSQVRAEVEEKAAPPPKTDLQVFTDAVRSWLPEAHNQVDDEVIRIVKEQRLGVIAHQAHGHCYVLTPAGFYTKSPVGVDKIGVILREQAMEWLVPTSDTKIDARDRETTYVKTWAHYLEDDVRTYDRTRMLAIHRGNYVSVDEAGNTQLIISPFWLRDLSPLWNDQVETWLQLAAADGQAEDLILALAYLLAFKHGPTAAVALIGPARVGKKLIARGLAECINTLQVCPGRVLVSRFNGGLINSPIVWIDEGLPRGKDGVDFADTFRNLVTGGPMTVEEKGKETYEVSGVHRVLITANNFEAIAQLGEGQARTQDDLDAISERLAVFKMQQRAADFLARTDTSGWIAGDNGSPSQFVIARHLLWHLQNTVQWEDGIPKKLGNRLLYEGKRDGLVQTTIDDANTEMTEVAATVNELVRKGTFAVKDGYVYVVYAPLRNLLVGPNKSLKPSEFRRALAALVVDKHSTRVEGQPALYQLMPVDRIASIASRVATVAPQLQPQQVQS